MTNDEYLKELASRGDGSLQAWFDAEHVENTRSAKRAAAVERVRKAKDAGTNIGYAIVGREYYPWEAYETLIELLTDDDGLRNKDEVAAEHGATRMTNLERLFVDSEQFRQAMSAFAFAHSDDCPTSPTQMVDWLMAPYVDAHSKPHSKTEQMLTEQSESLSDANDDLAPESDIIADAMDANDENATCNNSGDFVTHDSREKLEADVREYYRIGLPGIQETELHRLYYEQVIEWLDRQAAITAKQLTSQSDVPKPVESCETDAAKGDIRDFDDSRKKLEDKAFNLIARMVNEAYTMGAHEADWSVNRQSVRNCITELFDGVAAITRKTEQAAWIQQANGLIHEANVERDELRGSFDTAKQLIEQYKADGVDNLRKIDELRNELAKRDKGIERLKRQRDEARQQISKLEAECDDCVYKLEWQTMDRLETERDALAADLRDCEQQRERLRQALGCAIDHAHEITRLVDIDGELMKEGGE